MAHMLPPAVIFGRPSVQTLPANVATGVIGTRGGRATIETGHGHSIGRQEWVRGVVQVGPGGPFEEGLAPAFYGIERITGLGGGLGHARVQMVFRKIGAK